MDELNDETPKLAEAVGVSKTHFKGGETQYKNSTIIAFPHHRTLATRKWFPHRTRAWRRERFLRPGAITPLPEDLRHG